MTCGKTLPALLEEFASHPVSAGRALGDLLARDRRQFFAAAIEALKSGARTPAHAHLLNLLIDNDLLAEALADPSKFSLEEAIDFFRLIARMDPLLDAKLARWLVRHVQPEPSARGAAALRVLRILEETSAADRLRPMLVQLLRFPDPAIRSKVALLLGRSTQAVRWAMGDADPRVRANATEAIWGVDSKETRRTLWALARDPNNRVVGNALLGLYKLGDPAAAEELACMSRHLSPRFRATAAWAMGQTHDRGFLEDLRRLEGDPDGNVRRNARLALARLRVGSTLEEAASEAPQAA